MSDFSSPPPEDSTPDGYYDADFLPAKETHWDPEQALRDLAEEVPILDHGDQRSAARRIFVENAAIAAQSIVNIAIYSPSDRTRLEASRYVIERNLGRLGETTEDIDDPLTSLMASVVISEEEAISRARTQLGKEG